MNITIEHSRTKREIAGPFNLCGNGTDLLAIANAIHDAVGDNRKFFGWVRVIGPQQPSIINTLPSSWDDHAARISKDE